MELFLLPLYYAVGTDCTIPTSRHHNNKNKEPDSGYLLIGPSNYVMHVDSRYIDMSQGKKYKSDHNAHQQVRIDDTSRSSYM